MTSPVQLALAGTRDRPLDVAVADDVGEIRDIVGHWLTEIGCNVTAAATGNELTKLMRSHHYDVIIMDVLMPDGDGLEVILEAKRTQPAARLLAISGGGRHLQAEDCLRFAKGLGAHGVLLKPFNREQLFAAIEALGGAGNADQAGLPDVAGS